MHTTFHFDSAEELNSDILDSIKAAYKSKAITIIVEEDEGVYELSESQKEILNQRLNESDEQFITAEESINRLKSKRDV